jgi:hypothetical protein
MKFAKLMSASALSLALGTAALLCTQTGLFAQEQRDETKPQQQDEARPDANKPAQDEPKAARPGDAKPAEQNEDRPVRDEKGKQDDKAVQHEDNNKQQMDRNVQTDKNQQMDRNVQTDKNQRSAGNRIPDDKFHSNFGRQHTFKVRVANSGGRPNFQYGGYSFTLVDAWPAGWAYTDDCYIDYIDGEYFLFDLAHPGIRIAVMVL